VRDHDLPEMAAALEMPIGRLSLGERKCPIVAAAPHQSAARSLAEVLPLDPPIQCSTRLLFTTSRPRCEVKPNILIIWNLYTRLRDAALLWAIMSPAV
jgi:hypothetical protein